MLKANSKPVQSARKRKRYKVLGDLKGYKETAEKENQMISSIVTPVRKLDDDDYGSVISTPQ